MALKDWLNNYHREISQQCPLVTGLPVPDGCLFHQRMFERLVENGQIGFYETYHCPNAKDCSIGG